MNLPSAERAGIRGSLKIMNIYGVFHLLPLQIFAFEDSLAL